MAWERVIRYRVRFRATDGKGDAVIDHQDTAGTANQTTVQLDAVGVAALAAMLALDQDSKIIFDPDAKIFDSGPEPA